jgi:hypothetical protein
LATAEEGIESQIRNIEARYGRPMTDWLAIIAASGLTKHTDVVAMLKADHGMAHGAAHRVSLLSRQAEAPAPSGEAVDALYVGKKANLRPLHDQLMAVINAFGTDVTTVPKKGYLSIRRKKQFAMIQPSPAGRLDVGLILPGTPPAAGWRPPGASTPCSPTGCGSLRQTTSTPRSLNGFTQHTPTQGRPRGAEGRPRTG